MLLAINANNTNVKFGVIDGDRIVGEWRQHTSAMRTGDEHAVWLMQLLALEKILEAPLIQHLGPAKENVVAQLDLALVHIASRLSELRQAMFKTDELGGGLARLPGRVVDGDLLQRTLALNDQHRNVDAGDQKAANDDRNNRFEGAQGQML